MSVREVPLDEPLHMPGHDGRNICDGEPFVTRLLDTSQTDHLLYPMCPDCWALVMAGATVGPLPVDTAAARPKEIPDADATVTFDRVNDLSDQPKPIKARAERLDT